eukprot:Blabericola_migrator_1__5639@NODE_2865_length_2265_cov_276_751592_g1798_i0_p2_GENE_NODE_2865_length_2265_cov_276_751592_g1798_i0NODE_2865_length_2265_cov_276_751592_g1798_i0_p2_ORF_typecomplete_len168_score24_43_NODE_2865_length_2265_cov_276_751592_g1798_i016832186
MTSTGNFDVDEHVCAMVSPYLNVLSGIVLIVLCVKPLTALQIGLPLTERISPTSQAYTVDVLPFGSLLPDIFILRVPDGMPTYEHHPDYEFVTSAVVSEQRLDTQWSHGTPSELPKKVYQKDGALPSAEVSSSSTTTTCALEDISSLTTTTLKHYFDEGWQVGVRHC